LARSAKAKERRLPRKEGERQKTGKGERTNFVRRRQHGNHCRGSRHRGRESGPENSSQKEESYLGIKDWNPGGQREHRRSAGLGLGGGGGSSPWFFFCRLGVLPANCRPFLKKSASSATEGGRPRLQRWGSQLRRARSKGKSREVP